MTLTSEERSSVAAIRLGNAAEALDDARLLIDRGSLRGAANRIYYAAFHAVSAFAVARGEALRTHRGVIAFFHAACVRTGLLDARFGVVLQKAFEDRSEADYDDDISLDHAQLVARLNEVADLVAKVRSVIEEQ